MKKVLLVLGSVRENRVADTVLDQVKQQFEGKDVELDVADFKATPLPFFNAPMTPSADDYEITDANAKAWQTQVGEADVVVFVTPEYNYSYTGVLKNAIDWVYKEWNEKPVAFIGYGWSGGSKAIAELRTLLTGFIQAAPIETEANLAFMKDINVDGTATGDDAAAKIKTVVDAITA